MKFIRGIFFLAASCVLLLHMLVPHDHHEASHHSLVHHSPNSLLEQIALGFHLAQPDGSLDNYNLGQELTLDECAAPPAPLLCFESAIILFSELPVKEAAQISRSVDQIHDPGASKSLSRRGPPQRI